MDTLLVEKMLTESRHQAQALILAGKVFAEGVLQNKPGVIISNNASLKISEPSPYVGRGGFKLKRALDYFGINPADKICLDIGASTGGFTDCLLQHGAVKVYAVDAGRGQLAWKLRQDPRVISMEKQNARYLSKTEIPEPIPFVTMDVSFISVMKILPAVKELMSPDGACIVLLKPQFEAKRENAKKGIVRDATIHLHVIQNFIAWSRENHFSPQNLTYSPITGSDGNIEFLIHLALNGPATALHETSVVEEAHTTLGVESP